MKSAVEMLPAPDLEISRLPIAEPAAAFDAELAPPIGTGGAAGAWRMSSMLWMGVIPQIASLENGQP